MDPGRNAPLRLLVIGGGAIANALLPRIARWPFEGITVADGDRVEAKNLDNQELFAPVDVGRPKSEVLAAWLRNMPIHAAIESVDAFVDENNAETLVAMHDVVADCTDDVHARRLIDRACRDYGVALVSGAVHGKQGQVIVLHAEGERDNLTLDRLFNGKPGIEEDGCDMRNVPFHVIEEVARAMANRLRALLHNERVVNGRIELFDGKVWIAVEPPVN